jgi:hypothetical protein
MDPARSPEVVCRLAALCNIEMFRATCVAVGAGSGARTRAVDGNPGAFREQRRWLT